MRVSCCELSGHAERLDYTSTAEIGRERTWWYVQTCRTSATANLLINPAVAVAWNTYQKLSQPCVQYGTSSSSLSSQACSTDSTTYPSSRTYSNVVTISGLAPATTIYYKIVSTNSSVEHFLSPRLPGDPTPFSMNAIIDLGVYGADGYTIKGDSSKRDTIPSIQPSLNHTTIGRLAQTVDDYEFIFHRMSHLVLARGGDETAGSSFFELADYPVWCQMQYWDQVLC